MNPHNLKQSDRSDEMISTYQSTALLINSSISVGVLSLQHPVVRSSGTDGIWVLLLSGLVIMLFVYLFTKLMQQFPKKGFVTISRDFLGRRKWIGKWLSAPVVIGAGLFWLMTVAIISRSFGEVLKTSVFVKTPSVVILLAFILGGALVVANSPQIIARYNEIVLPFLFLPIPLLLISLVQEGELVNILPLFQLDWWGVIRGVFQTLFIFAGYSVIFVYMAYYQEPRSAVRSHMWGMGIIISFYWITLLSSLAVFGPVELERMMWPTLELVKMASVPGMIFERMESIFLVIWVIAVFTTILNVYGAYVDMVIHFFSLGKESRKWVAWGSTPLLFLLSLWPSDLNEVIRLREMVVYSEWVVYLLISLVLVGAWLNRQWKKRRSGNAHTM